MFNLNETAYEIENVTKQKKAGDAGTSPGFFMLCQVFPSHICEIWQEAKQCS